MTRSSGVMQLALLRLWRNPLGLFSLAVVVGYLGLIVISALGLVAADWDTRYAESFAAPSFMGRAASTEQNSVRVSDHRPILLYGAVDPLAPVVADLKARGIGSFGHEDQVLTEDTQHGSVIFGADKWGRSVLLKVIKGAQTSVLVGLLSALFATALGTVLGALAGYWGRSVDAALEWLYGVMTAVPYLLLVLAIAAVLQQKGVFTIVCILGVTGWTGVYRLIRAEYMKHKVREYVLAAKAIGASHGRRMFIHILPNTSHVILVQLSQQVVNFIKAEVILSFLGFGVPVDVVSWGSILNETPNELILGHASQLLVCGGAMAVLVTAFALLTDALRDALDPRLK